MAYPADPDEEQRNKALGVESAPAPMAAPVGGAPVAGGAAPAAPAPAHHGTPGTGYVNLSRYVQANQSGAQGMADAIGGDVTKLGNQAMADADRWKADLNNSLAPTASAVDPALQTKLGGEVQQTMSAAQALQTPGGIGGLLTQHYGGHGGYGSGMRGFDSFLTGGAGGAQFQQLGQQYGGLDKYVSGLSVGYKPVVPGSGPGTGGGARHAPSPTPTPVGPAQPPGLSGVGGAGAGGASEQSERRRRRTV